MVFVTAAACPHCGATDFGTQRSVPNGDGSRTKLAVCRKCAKPFKIIAEFPEPGNVAYPVEFPEVGNVAYPPE
jgi:hypothetical protein